jgi:hypothetical protein
MFSKCCKTKGNSSVSRPGSEKCKVSFNTVCGTADALFVPLAFRRAIRRSDCFHQDINNPCYLSNNPWIILFGALQIVMSQIQDIDRMWWLSIMATVMSFTYAFIGLGECIAGAARAPHLLVPYPVFPFAILMIMELAVRDYVKNKSLGFRI